MSSICCNTCVTHVGLVKIASMHFHVRTCAIDCTWQFFPRRMCFIGEIFRFESQTSLPPEPIFNLAFCRGALNSDRRWDRSCTPVRSLWFCVVAKLTASRGHALDSMTPVSLDSQKADASIFPSSAKTVFWRQI